MVYSNAFIQAVCVWLLHLLIGCGGGAGADTGTHDSVSADSTLKGVVVDDYLIGAKVCLDLNSNWLCESGEPYTYSSSGGKYVLDISPLKYWETYDKLVLAEINENVIDESSGKALKDLGKSGYILAASGGHKPILSPINTLGVTRYFPNNLKDIGTTYILSQLAKSNGLSTTVEDYLDLNSPLNNFERELAKKTGKVIASALEKSQSKLISSFPEQFFIGSSALGSRSAQIVIQALGDTVAINELETESEKIDRINRQIDTIATSLAYEKLLQTPVVLLNPSEALDLLNNGICDVSLLSSTPRALLSFKSQNDGGSLQVSNHIYKSNQWAKDLSFNNQGSAGNHILVKYEESGLLNNEAKSTVIAIQNSILIKTPSVLIEKFSADSHAPLRQIRIVARQVEGLPFASVPGLAAFEGYFTTGQKIFQIQRKTLNDEYVFDGISVFFNSLVEFLASPRTCYAGVCWTVNQVNLQNNQSSGGTMKFTTTSNAGSLELGEAKFVIDEIAGIRFLKMKDIPISVQNRSSFWSAKDGRVPIFADFENRLWIGRFSPSSNYWNSEWLLSIADLNLVLATASLSTYNP